MLKLVLMLDEEREVWMTMVGEEGGLYRLSGVVMTVEDGVDIENSRLPTMHPRRLMMIDVTISQR